MEVKKKMPELITKKDCPHFGELKDGENENERLNIIRILNKRFEVATSYRETHLHNGHTHCAIIIDFCIFEYSDLKFIINLCDEHKLEPILECEENRLILDLTKKG